MLEKAHLSVCKEKETTDGSKYLLRVFIPKWKGVSGIKQLICCIRRFQRLGLYSRCFLLLTLAFFLLVVYHFNPLTFSTGKFISPTKLAIASLGICRDGSLVLWHSHTGWVPPDSCVAEDCQLQEPLPLSLLSPNLLLVLVHASARDKETRDMIRETWLSGLSNHLNFPIQYRWGLWSSPTSYEVKVDRLRLWVLYVRSKTIKSATFFLY